MGKTFATITLVLFSVAGIHAKTLRVESFEPAPFDLSASTKPRLDNNGTPCALVKVALGEGFSDLSFEGNVVEKINDGSEIQAYITGGTKQIVIKAAGLPPLNVVFSDHGVYRLFSKQVYNLSLCVDDAAATPAGSAAVSIHELFDNSDVDPVDDMVARANTLYAAGEVAKAVPLLQRAAELGHTEAQLSLGLLSENGVGSKPNWVLKPDPKNAFVLVQKSAQQGYVPAQKVLSRYYLTGLGVAADAKRGEYWREVYDRNNSNLPNDTDTNFRTDERQPEYPGGESQLFQDINKQLKYPAIAAETGKQGRIIYQFEVGKDGSISDIRVVRSLKISPFREIIPGESEEVYAELKESDLANQKASIKALEEAGIQAISRLKKFYPGLNNGAPVKMTFVVPVTWRLQ